MLLVFRTFRKDCPAELCLRASEDGTSLVVRRFTKEHNHATSRVRQYVVIYTYSLCVMLKAICSGFGLCLTCKASLRPYQRVQCTLQDFICCLVGALSRNSLGDYHMRGNCQRVSGMKLRRC